jgi:hypothetical protein
MAIVSCVVVIEDLGAVLVTVSHTVGHRSYYCRDLDLVFVSRTYVCFAGSALEEMSQNSGGFRSN